MNSQIRTNERIATGTPVPSGSATAAIRANETPRSPAWAWAVRRRVALLDALAIYAAVFVAYLSQAATLEADGIDAWAVRGHYAITAVVLLGVWLAALALADSRDVKIMGSGPREYARVSNATFAVLGLAAVVGYWTHWSMGRAFLAIAFPVGLVLLNVGRSVMRAVLVKERRAGLHSTSALVVGEADGASHLIDALADAPSAGLRVVAACVPGSSASHLRPGIEVIPNLDDVVDYVGANRIDAVVVTGTDELPPRDLQRLAWGLEQHHADLMVAPGLADVAETRIHARPIAGIPMLQLEAPGYTSSQQRYKRAIDVVGASLLIAVFAVPLLITALIIKWTSPGPILFRQTRIGENGKPFQMIKFRSMVVDAEARLAEVLGGNVGMFYKPKNDPRITPIGRFIRRYSIDEMPQLFNVLGGSMSLVGPRPQIPQEVALYDSATSRRLFVKPGMTGLWQVSGRNNLEIDKAIRLDLYYVENWSLTEDLLILARTAKAVVGKDGAS